MQGSERAETAYAQTRLGRIAYRSFGGGPVDVLVVTGQQVPVDALLDEPRLVRWLDRLSRFCRHIWFDPRGRGASDPLPEDEARFADSLTADAIALLDTLGIATTAVLDLVPGTSPWLPLAATHPERVSALVLRHPSARMRRAADYPHGWSDEGIAQFLAAVEESWGTVEAAKAMAGSAANDAEFLRWLARCQRGVSSPAAALWRLRAMWYLDARSVLPAIKVPTLVITPSNGRSERMRGHYVAEHIAGSREVELPGEFLFFTGDPDPTVDAIEEFLTGKLATHDTNRVLATVLFTDVVESTTTAAQLGDRRWRVLLEDHYRVAGRIVLEHGGRVVKTTGDGILATFDAPGRAIRAAQAITTTATNLEFGVRAGLHAGEIELVGDDVAGIAVHIGQRVMSSAGPNEVLVSRTVVDLVAGSGTEFIDRGMHALKGVPDMWQLFAVGGRVPSRTFGV